MCVAVLTLYSTTNPPHILHNNYPNRKVDAKPSNKYKKKVGAPLGNARTAPCQVTQGSLYGSSSNAFQDQAHQNNTMTYAGNFTHPGQDGTITKAKWTPCTDALALRAASSSNNETRTRAKILAGRKP